MVEGKKKGKNDEEEPEPDPFHLLDTNIVLREARVFNEPQINAAKCSEILKRILWLLTQGERFSAEESTNIFFSVTKLFQSEDPHLRRLIYLFIKEMKVSSDEGLIVVSCLSKDMTSKSDMFRANAIRVLAKIMDPQMIAGIERFLKAALVDKNPFVVSSTLVAAQHLMENPGGADAVKRWATQIQEALNNKSKTVQYQALALLKQLRQSDRLALSKVASQLVRNVPKGPLAHCLLISIVASLLQDSSTPQQDLVKFLTDSLQGKNFVVTYEAARAMCSIPSFGPGQVNQAVIVLQEFLSSPIPTQRFAAVRTLSEVVVKFPLIVSPCTADLERLIADGNRNIATLAITTLLKTGMEANVDRLMKSISGFMTDIPDEFKVVLVDAIKTLCLKFPQKHHTMLAFLSSALREEGGFLYKKAIVDATLSIIDEVKDAHEAGLEQLCEFIEDCEFPELCIKILHVLGEKGPKTSNPAKYIRFMFNRVILETASVRSAAVSALAKFAIAVPALLDNVVVLLKRCVNDNDDEVRDRAIFYLNLFSTDANKHKAKAVLLHNPVEAVSLSALEASLTTYLAGSSEEAFSLQKVVDSVVPEPTAAEKRDGKKGGSSAASSTGGKKDATSANPYLELLNSIPEIAVLPGFWRSSAPVELTETETEYVVNCVKHIYERHIVFQFNVTNNMQSQRLENVSVAMQIDKEGWEEEMIIPEPTLTYQVPGTCFVCFAREPGAYYSGPIANTLKFTVRDVDSNGEAVGSGVEDEYQLEEFSVSEADFMKPDASIGLLEFKKSWEALGAEDEGVKKFSLGADKLQAAVDAVVEMTNMAPCENSGSVPEGVTSHGVNLHGVFLGATEVFCRAGFMMAASGKGGVTLKLAVRSANKELNQTIVNCIR